MLFEAIVGLVAILGGAIASTTGFISAPILLLGASMIALPQL